MKLVKIVSPSRANEVISIAYRCDTYLSKLRGLTFRRGLPDGKALLLVESANSKISSAIHMWAVFFKIGVVWINSEMKVVDRVLAKPWRVYAPSQPAMYILEDNPSILDRVDINDCVQIISYDPSE